MPFFCKGRNIMSTLSEMVGAIQDIRRLLRDSLTLTGSISIAATETSGVLSQTAGIAAASTQATSNLQTLALSVNDTKTAGALSAQTASIATPTLVTPNLISAASDQKRTNRFFTAAPVVSSESNRSEHSSPLRYK